MLAWRSFYNVFFFLLVIQGLVIYGLLHNLTPAPRHPASPAGELRVNPVLRVPVNPPNPFI